MRHRRLTAIVLATIGGVGCVRAHGEPEPLDEEAEASEPVEVVPAATYGTFVRADDATPVAVEDEVCADEEWTTTIVDSAGLVGRSSSIAVDATGDVHVAYGALMPTALRYAHREERGNWSTTSVATDQPVTSTSIALEPTGRVHLLWGAAPGGVGELYEATHDLDDTWESWLVARQAAFGTIAFDPGRIGSMQVREAIPHVAYIEVRSGVDFGLQYMRLGIYGWENALLDATNPDIDPRIAIDPYGRIHVAYTTRELPSGKADALYHAMLAPGGTWVTTRIDTVTDPHIALAVDRASIVHVAYRRSDLGGGPPAGFLRYARRNWSTGEWETELVDDTSGVAGETPSIAVGADLQPHVVYIDRCHRTLRYAQRDALGRWTLETIGPAQVEAEPAIALDARSGVHVSYYDALQGDLVYAHARRCAIEIGY